MNCEWFEKGGLAQITKCFQLISKPGKKVSHGWIAQHRHRVVDLLS